MNLLGRTTNHTEPHWTMQLLPGEKPYFGFSCVHARGTNKNEDAHVSSSTTSAAIQHLVSFCQKCLWSLQSYACSHQHWAFQCVLASTFEFFFLSLLGMCKAKAATSHNFRILNCFIQFFNPSPWRKPRKLSTPLMPSLTSFARTLGRTTSAIFWWHWAEGSRRRDQKMGLENGKIHEIHVIP